MYANKSDECEAHSKELQALWQVRSLFLRPLPSREHVCVSVCVCVREREREGERVYVCLHAGVSFSLTCPLCYYLAAYALCTRASYP